MIWCRIATPSIAVFLNQGSSDPWGSPETYQGVRWTGNSTYEKLNVLWQGGKEREGREGGKRREGREVGKEREGREGGKEK